MPADMLAVGVITANPRLAGEVKGKSFSGEQAHFSSFTEAVFRSGTKETTRRIESARPASSRCRAEDRRGGHARGRRGPSLGAEIWVPRRQAARLGEGEYYAADLCRCRLWFGEELIGEVRSVWDGGPAQLLEVATVGEDLPGAVHRTISSVTWTSAQGGSP